MTTTNYVPIPGLSLLYQPVGEVPVEPPIPRNGVVSVPQARPQVIAALKAALGCACHQCPTKVLDNERFTLQVRSHVGSFRSLYPHLKGPFRVCSMHVHAHPVSTHVCIIGSFHIGTRAFGYSAVVDSGRVLRLTILSGVTPPPPKKIHPRRRTQKNTATGEVLGSIFA